MPVKYSTVVLLALTGLALPSPARAEVVRVMLKDAPPAEIQKELSRALAAPVEVRGGAGRTVSVTLSTASPSLTLDRVAALLGGGTWRMKLRVRPAPAGTDPSPSPRPILERNLLIGLQDVPGDRAFANVARELRADLEEEGELQGRVTLPPVNLPVNTLLDRIGEQAGATWSIRYVIDAVDVPPVVIRIPGENEIPAPKPMPVLPDPVVPISPPPPRAPTATQLRAALWADIHFLVRVDPSAREVAVIDFIEKADRRIAALSHLPPLIRAERIRHAATILKQWRRLYVGLAPNVKKELAPVSQWLERNLRA
jgi:hypothetical protein